MLIDELIKDEKKIDRLLYSSGPYWNYKNSRAILEIKKRGIQDFRGLTAGIGTSFSDNQVLDIRNEYNIRGRIIGKIFSLPLLKTIFNSQLKLTESYIKYLLLNKSIVYKNDENVHNLLKKYKFENTTEFGCISSFKYLNKKYSCHYLDMADRINKLSKQI